MELHVMTLFYSFVTLISYFLMSVGVWISFDRDNIMRVFSASYHQTHTSPIIRGPRKPRKPHDPIEVLNDGHITDLNKVKLNTGPVIYDISPTI